MDFAWTPEQLALKKSAIAFAETLLKDDEAVREGVGTFPRDAWRRCAEYGIQGMAVPSSIPSGRGTDFLDAMLVMEGLGYGCRDNGLAFALNAQMWTVQLPIVHHGSEEQKRKYLPGMCDGSLIGAHAVTEPDAGSDAFSMRTRAQKCDGGYLLSGVKRYISLAPVADLILVFASIDPELGRWGITAFLVDRGSPGLQFGPEREKMGLRTVPMGDLTLDECFVPTANRLGAEGAGLRLSTTSLDWERCCILASQLGAMQRQLETACSYVRTRKQFGQQIGKFQSVANRVVDMKLRLETSRLMLYQVAWLKREGRDAMMESAMLKLHLSECFLASSTDAIRVHGALGYMSENGIERDLRDAVGGTIYAGTSDIQRNVIAALLGL